VSAHSLIELVYAVERPTNPFSEEDRQAVLETSEAEDSPFEVVFMAAEIVNPLLPSRERRTLSPAIASSLPRPRSWACRSSVQTRSFRA
jgi:hypothetical protein